MHHENSNNFPKPFFLFSAQHVQENQTRTPYAVLAQSVAAKSGNKVAIIQAIDRKLDLKDIAASKGLDMDSLLTEIEAIVATGTRININYYIEEELDPEVVEEIFTWFKEEATSDSLADTIQALSDEYEEEEIRLVRIKFLCEVAN